MSQLVTRRIPATDHYKGMLCHSLGGKREICVFEDSERGELILKEAVERDCAGTCIPV